MMKRIIGITALLALVLVMAACGNKDKVITAEEAKARMDSGDKVVVVDVRTPEEYKEEHIKGAINVPEQVIADEKTEEYLPDKDAEILVYCKSGNRSATATARLVKLGYTNVKDFGGIEDWPYEKEKGESKAEKKTKDKTKGDGILSSFESTDMDNKPVDASIFKGKKLTMVNIWATFCGPCIQEMPDLSQLNKEYADKGFQVVGIPVDTMGSDGKISDKMVDTAKDVIKEGKADYLHILPSESLNKAKLSQVQSVPETIFVDENGKQVGESYIGSRSKEDWAKIIEKLLKEV
jgi:rhodanese-related sulfurtransferase/glutathione peroxidase-family protein